MAGIDLRLQTVRRAIVAFRDTPGRTGRIVQLADCDEILVAGDMHGHVENFRRLLVKADPAAHLRDPTADADVAPGGSLYSVVWGRDVREETLAGYLKRMDADRLISGHIPCDRGVERPSPGHVILDSQGSQAGYVLLRAD